jgi:O-acetyl-ADP-ribose deacetylase (regulator of RNase III)
MGLLGGRRQLRPRSFATKALDAFLRLPAIKRPLSPTEGTLARSVAFTARMGSRLGGVDKASAATPMADARTEAEWADIRA